MLLRHGDENDRWSLKEVKQMPVCRQQSGSACPLWCLDAVIPLAEVSAQNKSSGCFQCQTPQANTEHDADIRSIDSQNLI